MFKTKRIGFYLRLALIILPVLYSFFFILSPWGKLSLISAATDTNFSTETPIQYLYNYTGDSRIIEQKSGSKFEITEDDITPPSLIKSTMNNIFDIPLGIGWHKICFHNINSAFYICGKNTNLNQDTVFTFNEEDIFVASGDKKCLFLKTNEEFYAIINNKMRYPEEESIYNYINKNKIKECPNIKPSIFAYIDAEIYIEPIPIIMIIKNLLLFFAWGGLVLLFLEIVKFIRRKIN